MINNPKLESLSSTYNLLKGSWKIYILWSLKNKPLRFGDLEQELAPITQKMLSQELKALQQSGLISRKSYPEIPPRVEYKLTDLGKSLLPILELMQKWGNEKLNKQATPEKTQLDLFS